jgi:hypothetical protein
VRFVRAVCLAHSASIGLASAWAYSAWVLPSKVSAWLGLGAALGLTAVRRWIGDAVLGRSLVLVLGAACVFSLAGLLRHGGVPASPLVVPSAAVALYALFCGRDFSYLGLGTLSLAASAATFGVMSSGRGAAWFWTTLALTAAWLFYVCYDLSMIVKRRRASEVAGGVADLYCDLLNWTTYPFRVWAHWRRYRFP